MTIKKAFAKNEKVVYFQCYDRKGTWTYTRAIVQSCGAKQMTLLNAETGVMMGRNFAPSLERTYTIKWDGKEFIKNNAGFTAKDMTEEEAIATCLAHGALTIKDENEHFDRCEASGETQGYINAIKKQREALHEPRAIKR